MIFNRKNLTPPSETKTIRTPATPLRKNSILRKFSLNFSLKKLLIILFIINLIFGIIFVFYYLIAEYKIDKYKISKLSYLNEQKVNNVMSDYLSTPLIRIDTDGIQNELVKKTVYIKKISVSKSIIDGIVIDIVENEPKVILKIPDDKLFLVTIDYRIIEIIDVNEVSQITKLNYLSNDLTDPNLSLTIEKILRIMANPKNTFDGVYSFDNFGNLSILQESNRFVRFDLNERFFTIDEQVSLLQDTLAKNRNFSEIDLRFNYLLIK